MSDTDKALADAIKTVAQAKIAEALGGDVLGSIIESVMNHKERTYNGGKQEKTVFETMVENQLRRAVEEAVREYLVTSSVQIKEAVAKAMEARTQDFAAIIVDSFASDDWRAELKVSIDRD